MRPAREGFSKALDNPNFGPGWNMLGGFTEAVDSDVFESLRGIVPPVYTYNPEQRRYNSPERINPGMGVFLLAVDSLDTVIYDE